MSEGVGRRLAACGQESSVASLRLLVTSGKRKAVRIIGESGGKRRLEVAAGSGWNRREAKSRQGIWGVRGRRQVAGGGRQWTADNSRFVPRLLNRHAIRVRCFVAAWDSSGVENNHFLLDSRAVVCLGLVGEQMVVRLYIYMYTKGNKMYNDTYDYSKWLQIADQMDYPAIDKFFSDLDLTDIVQSVSLYI